MLQTWQSISDRSCLWIPELVAFNLHSMPRELPGWYLTVNKLNQLQIFTHLLVCPFLIAYVCQPLIGTAAWLQFPDCIECGVLWWVSLSTKCRVSQYSLTLEFINLRPNENIQLKALAFTYPSKTLFKVVESNNYLRPHIHSRRSANRLVSLSGSP